MKIKQCCDKLIPTLFTWSRCSGNERFSIQLRRLTKYSPHYFTLDYGDDRTESYMEVSHCPFCGTKLEIEE